jgi:hypothetical protein
VALALGGCASARALTLARGAAPEDEAGIYEATAQQNAMAIAAVQGFYDWYLGYPGNVTADRAYCSSEHLAASFVDEVDELLASFDQGGYDFFLCAQDIPGDLIVDDEVSRLGNAATIAVYQVFNPGTEYEAVGELAVELEMVDGAWKISNIVCK